MTPNKKTREEKTPYESPKMHSYSKEELAAALGPAIGTYGDPP